MKSVVSIRLCLASALLGAAGLWPSFAQAAFTLKLSSGSQSVTITDGGANDKNDEAGAITFIGAVGTFTLNVTTGLSNPTYPLISQPFPMLDLNSVDVSSSATGGVLTIELWDQFDAMGGGLALINDAGGTFPSASVDFLTTITPVVGSPVSSDVLTLSGNADSGSLEKWIDGGLSAFELKQTATITTTAYTTLSFDFSSKVVPEPATVMVWSGLFLGLAATGLVRRRNRAT